MLSLIKFTTLCFDWLTMKKILLLSIMFIILFLNADAQTQSITNIKFLNNVINKNWPAAESCLSAFLKSQFKDGRLQKTFADLSGQIGDLKQIDTISGNSSEGNKVYRYIAHFEKETLTIQIAGNDSLKIAGFYLLPLSNSYSSPAYAISAKIVEQKVSIPSGTIKLKGVFTKPVINGEKKSPLIIFVGGSGPTDEDETMEIEKPFKDLALGLAVEKIATIRFAKKTHSFPAKYKDKNYTIYDEYLEDVKNVIAYAKTLREIDTTKIIILGHSLGGMLAPLLMQQNPSIRGAILLEANARPLEDLIYEQSVYLSQLKKDTTGSSSLQTIKSEVQSVKNITGADSSKLYFNAKGSYWLSLKAYDPLKTAKSIKKRNLLIIQGGKDYQVTEKDYLLWKKTLSSNAAVAFKFYPKITHAIVETDESPSPANYSVPLNVPYYIITDISSWLKEKF